MSKNKRQHANPKQSNKRILQFSIIALVAIGIIVGIIFRPAFQTNASQVQAGFTSQTNRQQVSQIEPVSNRPSSNSYEGIPGPADWTQDTPVQLYNRLNGIWEAKTYRDVGPDMEFIVGDYVYATSPENGALFLKVALDITKLAEADQPFDPDNWRMPQPDDIVFLYKSGSNQQKGHWLLKDVQPDSEIVFQGKVWLWELDLAKQRFVVKDTGNVLAKVTDTHKDVHQGDVLALTVQYEVCGKLGLITGSEEHPFYVLEKEDYLPMVELLPGMALKTDNGAQATVVELKSLPEAMALYNLTVENVHNYYIFPSENEPGLLVHNINCFGEIKFSGLNKNRNVGDLTHNQIYNTMSKQGLEPSNHFIKRIRERGTTLGDLENHFNHGQLYDAGDGVDALVYGDTAVLFDRETGRLTNFRPAKPSWIPYE